MRSSPGCSAVTSSSASSARSSPCERVPSTLVRVRSRSTISVVAPTPTSALSSASSTSSHASSSRCSRESTDSRPRPRVVCERDSRARSRTRRPAVGSGTSSAGSAGAWVTGAVRCLGRQLDDGAHRARGRVPRDLGVVADTGPVVDAGRGRALEGAGTAAAGDDEGGGGGDGEHHGRDDDDEKDDHVSILSGSPRPGARRGGGGGAGCQRRRTTLAPPCRTAPPGVADVRSRRRAVASATRSPSARGLAPVAAARRRRVQPRGAHRGAPATGRHRAARQLRLGSPGGPGRTGATVVPACAPGRRRGLREHRACAGADRAGPRGGGRRSRGC